MAWESSTWKKTLWKGDGWFIVVEEEYAIDPFEPRRRAKKYGEKVAVEALKNIQKKTRVWISAKQEMIRSMEESGITVAVGGKKREYKGEKIREALEATWWPKAPVAWTNIGIGDDFIVFEGRSVRGTGLEKYWVVVEWSQK